MSSKPTPPPTVDLTPIKAGSALTVEARITAHEAGVEAMQPIVSQWQPLATPRFNAYDATLTDGLTCSGYYGAVFDGRHVYGCPIRSHRERDTVHGHQDCQWASGTPLEAHRVLFEQ